MEKLRSEIDKLSREDLLDLYNKTYSKIQMLDDRIRKFTLYSVIILFIYLVSTNANFDNLQIGPVVIKNLPEAAEIIPLLFAYLLLELATSTFHRFEVSIFSQYIFKKINPQIENLNSLTQIVFPFYIWAEIAKIDTKGKFGLLAYLLIVLLPVISIFVLPIGFEILLLKNQSMHLNNTITIISFSISIWLTLISIWYVLSVIKQGIKEKLLP